MNEYFWKVINKNLPSIHIPNFIKNGISDASFDNAFIFKNISDEHIKQIEKHIREEALNLRITKLSESFDSSDSKYQCEALLDNDEMIDIFGPKYATTPEKFKFHPGEIVLIRELVNFVKEIVDRGGENKGLHHFQERKRRVKSIDTNKKKRRVSNENELLSKDEVNSDLPAVAGAKTISRNFELKSKLFSLSTEYLKAYNVDEQIVTQFNEQMVDLEIKSGVVHGRIVCIVCKVENKRKKKNSHSVHYHESAGSNYWVLSNFKKHLESIHKLVRITPDLRTKNKRQKCPPLREWNEEGDLNYDKSNGHDEKTSGSLNEADLNDNNSIEYIEVPVDSKNEIEEDKISNTDDVIIHSIVHAGEKTINTQIDSMYTQISKQIAEMVGVVLVNGESIHNVQFKLGNEMPMVSVASIVGDGNCLFGSICHQIFHDPINSNAHKKQMKDLRAQVVEYILKPENFPLFEFTLQDRVYEYKSKKEISDMTMECKLFVRLCLSKNGFWAGQEALAAVGHIHKVNILVFSEDGDVYLANAGKTTEIYNKTIALAYRLDYSKSKFNHYDSVCDIDSDILYAVSEKIQHTI